MIPTTTRITAQTRWNNQRRIIVKDNTKSQTEPGGHYALQSEKDSSGVICENGGTDYCPQKGKNAHDNEIKELEQRIQAIKEQLRIALKKRDELASSVELTKADHQTPADTGTKANNDRR